MIHKLNFFLTDVEGMPDDTKAKIRLEEMIRDLLKTVESEKEQIKFPRKVSENGLTFAFTSFKEWDDYQEGLKNEVG